MEEYHKKFNFPWGLNLAVHEDETLALEAQLKFTEAAKLGMYLIEVYSEEF